MITFTSDNIKKIRKLNEIDIAVYQKALELFNGQFRSDAGTIESNWACFQNQQRSSQLFLLPTVLLRRPLKLLKRITGRLYVSY